MITIKLRYNESDENDRVEYRIDKAAGKAYVEYHADGAVIDANQIDIQPIINVNTSADLKVELAKKGLTWDLHIKNVDPVTKQEHRQSLSLVLDRDLTVIESIFDNPSSTDYTLRDLLTYELITYNSSLNLGKIDFETSTGITGQSSSTELNPVIQDGGLVLRDNALIDIDLTNAPVDLTETRYVAWDFVDMPSILAIQPYMLEFTLGANEFVLGPNGLGRKGTGTNPSILIIPSALFAPNTSIVFVFDKNGNDAVLYRGVRYNTTFDKSQPIDDIRFIGSNHTGTTYVIDNLLIQASSNFFMDSEPPARVQDVEYVTGDKEVYVQWKANTEEDIAGYNVYVDGIRNNLVLITNTNFQATGLTNGFSHKIVITAVDLSGNESIPTEPFVITTSSSPEKEVQGIAKYHNALGLTLTFTPPVYANLNAIRIYREDLSNLGLQMLDEITPDSVMYQDMPLPPAGKYRYVVTTIDTLGNETTGVSVNHYINNI